MRAYIEKARSAARGETWDFLLYALETETNECILWPFGKAKGRGRVWRRDKKKADDAATTICELAHGPKPAEMDDAAHRCGNALCMNKRHVRWATTAQNQADRLFHGTGNRGAKHGMARITEAQARRAKYGTEPLADMAFEIGCGYAALYAIRTGRSWAWL